jgi:hypothetical protein
MLWFMTLCKKNYLDKNGLKYKAALGLFSYTWFCPSGDNSGIIINREGRNKTA